MRGRVYKVKNFRTTHRFRKKYKSEDLKDKGYKWAYSRSKGYYIGMKLVLAKKYHSLKPLDFLV